MIYLLVVVVSCFVFTTSALRYADGSSVIRELRARTDFKESPLDTNVLYYLSKNLDASLRVAIICGLHARELIASDVCMHFVRTGGLRKFETQTHNTALLFVPLANAQGRDRVIRANQSCWRGNARGVDLNRNWPMLSKHITDNACQYNSRVSPCAHNECNAGSAPLSENETHAIDALLRRLRPHIVVSIHSGVRALLLPYDACWRAPRNYAKQVQYANWLRASLHNEHHYTVVGTGMATLYASNGTLCDYAHDILGATISITAEVYGGDATIYDCHALFNPRYNSVAYHAVLNEWSNGLLRRVCIESEIQDALFEMLIN